MRTYLAPTQGIKTILEAVCILFNSREKVFFNGTYVLVPDLKGLFFNPKGFLNRINMFDYKKIKTAHVRELEKAVKLVWNYQMKTDLLSVTIQTLFDLAEKIVKYYAKDWRFV